MSSSRPAPRAPLALPLPLRRLGACAGALALTGALLPAFTAPALAATVTPGAVVVQEIYGGGGNSGAKYTHDFVELHNTTDAAVSIEGWSLQYTSAGGTFTGAPVVLHGSIPAGSTYLVQLGKGQNGTDALPTPDAEGGLSVGGTGGVIALSNQSGALQCTASACSESPAVIDLVGWGSSAKTFSGSAPAPATSNTTSIARVASTGENSTDFAAGAPTPESTTGGSTGPTDPTDPTDPTPQPGTVVPIADIQGTGAASPLAGTSVTTEGVVTAVYATGGLNGYVIQTGGTGGALDFSSHAASDAIFVYSSATASTVAIGDSVRVTGTVSEFNGLTQITVAAGGVAKTDTALAPVQPATFDAFPTEENRRESIESMLYLPGEGDFTVTDVYPTNQYGEIGLAIGDEPLRQPGDVMRPGAEATAMWNAMPAQKVILDDAKTTNFQTKADEPMSWLRVEEPVRVGAHPTFTKPVVVTYSFNSWRLNPTSPWTSHDTDGVDFEDTRKQAPAAPGGDLQVGTFNVLNYFTTLGAVTPGCVPYTDRAGVGLSVRSGCDLRGAWDQASFGRQQEKIVSAISASGNDVAGLMEIENSARIGETPDEATATLVAALNERDGAGTWAFVPTGPAYEKLGLVGGQDVITSAIIYQPAKAKPVGDVQILAKDRAFSNAREPIGQVFVPVDGEKEGEPFFFVVNHFKSKGSADSADKSLPADPVQGNSRTSRLNQATALDTWVSAKQSELGVEDVLLGGDFNAYTQEEPLQVFYAKGYKDVGSTFDPEGWSYSFGGAVGSLDHVIANSSAMERLTGATDWSINGPESPMAQYSRHNQNAVTIVEPGPFGASDHNPLIVGMKAGFPGGPTDPTDPAPRFSDVTRETTIFYDDIMWLAEQGITTGYPDGTFRPMESVNRDAMAAYLYRMAGSPAVSTPRNQPFTDVKPGMEHYDAIIWAYQEGIVKGYADGTFRPTQAINRDAMAAFLYRYAGSPSVPRPTAAPFADVPADSQFATEIAWLKAQGVTTGWYDGTYRPLATMNRESMAAFLHRSQVQAHITFAG
ncbi:ExeM/NucH family extracellular endonuclease [Brachybacterium huguangmaarense]